MSCFVRAVAFALCTSSFAANAAGGVFDLEITQLKPDIYVLQRPDFLRQPVEPNALVIVNDADVVVVDPGGVPLSAEHAIALIRSVTNKPVSVLVNTHWHGDHVLGNQIYRREFPNVRIVSHVNTYRDITGAPMQYIGRQDKQFTEIVNDWEAKAAKGTLEPRFAAMLPDVKTAMLENRRVQLTPPDTTFTDEIVLHRGAREIHIKYLGRGNTEGDAIVWLPKERVLESGISSSPRFRTASARIRRSGSRRSTSSRRTTSRCWCRATARSCATASRFVTCRTCCVKCASKSRRP